MAMHPIACMAAFDTATPSAPRARALANDERNLFGARGVEVAPRPRQGGNRGHRDVVAEDERRRAGGSAAPVQNDVVHPHLERGIDVLLDVLRRELEADGYATGGVARLSREGAEVGRRGPVGEARGGDRGLSLRESPHLRDLALHLLTRQVPARPRLGGLPALEVHGLHLLELVHREPEPGRGQLVQVARVLGLLFGEHPPLARGDTGTGQLGAARERDLGLLRQRAEAHVGDEQRDVEPQRSLRPRADREVASHLHVVELRRRGELRRHELDAVPAWQLGAGHPHRRHRTVRALQPLCGEPLDRLGVRLLGRTVHVLVRTLVGVSVERLRVLALPRGDLVGIDPHGAILHPGGELVQPLGVVVLADAGAELEVPLVHAADQVLALNGAVGQQRSPVQATAVQHRDLVIVTDDDEVHVPHQGEGRCAVLERCFCMSLLNCGCGRAVPCRARTPGRYD
jgi:hypothetical protein